VANPTDDEVDWTGLMEPLARHFLGEPNRTLSTKETLRWGSNGSMAVDVAKGVWFDNEADKGGGSLTFAMRELQQPQEEALLWLKENYPGFFPQPRKANGDGRQHGVFERAYRYTDEAGKVLFEVVRMRDPKTFLQRRPDPTAEGGWTWKTKGVRQVIYRLPEVLAAIAAGRTIHIVEGEKDVDRLWKVGLAATCNAGGAGKWRPALNVFLQGADVVVIGDHDPQSKHPKTGELLWHSDGRPQLRGQDHAEHVAKQLLRVAIRLRLVRDLAEIWPETPWKGDVSDYLDAGKTAAELTEVLGLLSDYTPPPPPAEDTKAAPAGIGDATLAKLFAAQNDDARFDSQWRTWDETRWRGDGAELRVLAAIREYLDREIAPTLRAKKDRTAVDSSGKLHAIAQELRLLRLISADTWDAQPWLLNTSVGTWELRGTPRLREHRRSDYLTRMTAVSAGGECPLWLNHIEFVSDGDHQYARFLQKLCGYALTGVRTAQIFAFLFGGGGNGKGVFLQTLAYVFGDYAATMMAEAFLQRRWEKHDEELTPLRGARLVIASEFPEEAEWNTARLKTVTGGDRIRASYKGRDSFEFEAQALLLLAGNDKPKLQSVDPGIVRRLRLLPFVNSFDDEHKDDDIRDKLQAEAGGILAWCIDGCRLLQIEGLTPPDVVANATAEYLGEQDLTRQWVEERCNTSELLCRTRIGVLFEDWKDYAKQAGVDAGNINALSSKIAKLGFERFRMYGVGRGFIGMQLKQSYTDEDAP